MASKTVIRPINSKHLRFPPRWTCFLWSIEIAFTTAFTGSACRFRTSTTGPGFEFCDHRGCTLDLKILCILRVLYQLQSYLPTNIGKNDAKTIFTLWRLERIFRRWMAMFSGVISELKRTAAKPSVVTRTFFRHHREQRSSFWMNK